MADVHDLKTRRKNMSAIRNRDTRPERIVSEILQASRFHVGPADRGLTGNPDFILPEQKIVIFVNGCFWHGHRSTCFKLPANNQGFWRKKINRNKERDRHVWQHYQSQKEWRCLVIWECALTGPARLNRNYLQCLLFEWIETGGQFLEMEPFLPDEWSD